MRLTEEERNEIARFVAKHLLLPDVEEDEVFSVPIMSFLALYKQHLDPSVAYAFIGLRDIVLERAQEGRGILGKRFLLYCKKGLSEREAKKLIEFEASGIFSMMQIMTMGMLRETLVAKEGEDDMMFCLPEWADSPDQDYQEEE